MLFPYFRLPKQRRRSRSRVISLVLHGVILVLCVLMVAGLNFRVTEEEKRSDVIILVDVSDSNRRTEEIDGFLQSVLHELPQGERVGVVSFANGAVFGAEMGRDGEAVYREYLGHNRPAGDATDIASALLYARDSLSDPANGRILLLSDGLETDGNALSAVETLAGDGVRVDTVFFSPEAQGGELRIIDLRIPDSAAFGDTVKLGVAVESSAAGPARFTLYDNGKEISSMEETIPVGGKIVEFDYTVTSRELHTFRVTADFNGDTLSQNNEYYACLDLKLSDKILLVDGTGTEADAILPLLGEAYGVTRAFTDTLPKSLEELAAYDEVILMNVADSDLPDGFDVLLSSFVESYGGGLFTVGGGKAYVQEDMQGTLYEKLLPVSADTGAKSLGLLLVIDKSTTMEINQYNGESYLAIAKRAAKASIETLASEDNLNYAGVISFNAEAYVECPMTPVTRASEITQKIDAIKIDKQGTYYNNAVLGAMGLLQNFRETELRHIIFLTDGEPNDSDMLETCKHNIALMAADGITLSTVALGSDAPAGTVKEMAEIGGGRSYSAERMSDLVSIMTEETAAVAGKWSNETPFTPSIMARTPAVAGIETLPRLDGYFGARLKEGATMVLGKGSSPVYASWKYGKGQVGSFLSDLSGKWSSAFLADENGKKFVLNAVESLFPALKNHAFDPMSAEFVRENFTTQIRVHVLGEGELSARVISPDGKSSPLRLEKQTDALFAGEFPTRLAGVYTVEIVNSSENVTLTAYTAFSYSDEYLAAGDEESCFAFMETLAERGNGTVIFRAEDVFNGQSTTAEKIFDPRLILLIAAAVLFLLDIAVRKFNFKSPREIKEQRKKEKR